MSAELYWTVEVISEAFPNRELRGTGLSPEDAMKHLRNRLASMQEQQAAVIELIAYDPAPDGRAPLDRAGLR